MHADELRVAVQKIVDVLSRTGVLTAVNQYRSARGDQRPAAAARLGHAGAMIMERFDAMSDAERRVTRLLHLDAMASAEYWQSLLEASDDAKVQQAEIVRLATRVMFANSTLPGMVELLESVSTDPHERFPLADGEGRLLIRLADAGERASDPDRVARAVDGIDMLYSACASIARRPAMDLRLEAVDGDATRDIHFTGEHDSIAAVRAVIESIPSALADLAPEDDINLDAIVGSLPIFEDLNTLAGVGGFSENDLKDISETMHQGALLALESGVLLVEPTSGQSGSSVLGDATVPPTTSDFPKSTAGVSPEAPSADAESPEADAAKGSADLTSIAGAGSNVSPMPRASNGAGPQSVSSGSGDPDGDEHYEQYLREREAMRQSSADPAVSPDDENKQKRDAIDDLLKSLSKARGDG